MDYTSSIYIVLLVHTWLSFFFPIGGCDSWLAGFEIDGLIPCWLDIFPIHDVLAQEPVMDDHKDAGIYALQGLKID